MSEAQALPMTLSDVAALAQVQRPAVSMWRKRSAGADVPFPEPATREGGRDLFDGDQVAGWLEATGRGNNPEAVNDVAAFARAPGVAPDGGPGNTLDALTALLTLKAITGRSLGQLGADEILDVADESDPDDLFLFSEVEAMGPALASTASSADRLVDSAYNPAAAFEHLLATRYRAGFREHADTAVAEPAVELIAAVAVELAAALGGQFVFADSTRGGSDLLLGVVRATGEGAPATFLTADDDGGTSRPVRRRLRVHGMDGGNISVGRGGEFTVQGPVVHVAQYPSPGEPGMDASEVLTSVEHLALQMDEHQRAVIMAPARVLCDVPVTGGVEELRSGLLRTGRVRAIVRLPPGLLPFRPREAQALWVLGPSFAEVPIAERWTLVADLSTRELTEGVRQDLVTDIVASMGNHATVRAHSFRFARLAQARVLLAGRGSFVAVQPRDSAPGHSDVALRGNSLVRLLHTGEADRLSGLVMLPGDPTRTMQPVSIQKLIATGHLKYIKGNRIDDAALASRDGIRVLGTAELLDLHSAPTPRDPGVVTGEHRSGQLRSGSCR
ncbi:hypothetical protein [Arthrobacter sp. H41]|uniref:hypothetical protein n=1 Tax=Arthrobacter sp. H41 TaxID=1312978 RepID=UPI0004AFEF39|nr:hypothetical protein [Arthrobacter sp. H41]